ncbi:5-hydroxytryptamine receptor 3C [Pimephales promelas]|uniref:5-hydroxytryptamine receptor 3C n=1 Tax=Pimephales promelas TaxID=90988 RepID=UPI0019559E6B|nr:5-hydroxytryptamine receptor 3C [Pimephales promelas]
MVKRQAESEPANTVQGTGQRIIQVSGLLVSESSPLQGALRCPLRLPTPPPRVLWGRICNIRAQAEDRLWLWNKWMFLSLLLGAKFPVPGSFVVWDSTTMQARLSPAYIDSILTSVSKIKQGQSLTVKKIETGSIEPLNCSEPTTKSLLNAMKEEVFSYSEARPVISLKTPTNVSVDLSLYGILGVNEKSQVLETYLWVRTRWQIEGLSWDPDECGTKKISLPREKLWVPDIVINEFMDENRVPDTYYVYVESTGEVMDAWPIHVISSCKLDIYTFPFDFQNCSYTFNSYKHSRDDVQLFFFQPAKQIFKQSLEAMTTKGEWELIDLLTEKPVLLYLEGGWDNLIVHIVLRRRATLYVVNLLIPSSLLLSLDLFSFLLPLQSVDRASFKMTLILGYTVFLLLMNDLLPVTGNNLPLINVFFSLCMALMVASLLETVIITNILCGSRDFPPLPKWLRILVLKYLAQLACMKKSCEENCDEHPKLFLTVL